LASKTPPHTPEHCIARAEECERMAEAAINAENKAIFLDLAQRWRKLAGEAESESFTPAGNRITNRRPSHC
jgi:hypothetical protein